MQNLDDVSGQDDGGDMPPISGLRDFFRRFAAESRKLWWLAVPAISTSICQYSLGAVTQVLAGHVSTLALAAVSVENSVIAGFSLGVLLGMGSALETLCGQAYGAGQVEMMGIYLQRSWIILFTSALLLSLYYVFATPLLRLIGQTPAISSAAGKLSLWMIPQLFAYALNFPTAKFLQAQSKVMVMAVISAVALPLHGVLSWWMMLKLRWGMAGGAAVLNVSWWLVQVAQIVYIATGACGRAWSGFSRKAFKNLRGFARLSIASAVMICLEVWYFMALILFAGYLKNAQVSVAALSICMNILGWMVMVAFGINAAVSVRVSNELGAGHPKRAKFSLIVATITSTAIGTAISMTLIALRDWYPELFSNDEEVRTVVKQLTPLLALCIIINNIQPVLSGVAVGAGWQGVIAYVNIGCYYIFGVPLGLVLGYKLKFGVKGIWCGMLTGTVVQICVLSGIIYKTSWNKEASLAEARIRKWGGEKDREENEAEMQEKVP
ncbi:PREDICTED: protein DETOXIFICATION 32 [Tarenaya hassleriana]|uniref:protein DETOXIFICATION 32 n=1 Tax=Tarenaya hassleriana TaxID=28532 RepID=UPI00053C6CF9|nr:PREDICTED: protein DETOXIFICATION 32 [Tarenaya hassleriana]